MNKEFKTLKEKRDMYSTRLLSLVLTSLFVVLPGLHAAPTYKIDPVHAAVIFYVKHMGVAHSYGRFNDVSGSYSIDAKDLAKSSIEVSIKATSIDTNNQKRDDHLRGPDFFKSKQFPTIIFKSKSIKDAGKDRFKVTGDLTLLGKTKTIEIEVTHVGTGKGRSGKPLSGYTTSFTIKRSDFGMNYGIPNIGDDVHLTISFEGAAS